MRSDGTLNWLRIHPDLYSKTQICAIVVAHGHLCAREAILALAGYVRLTDEAFVVVLWIKQLNTMELLAATQQQRVRCDRDVPYVALSREVDQ